MMTCMVRIEAGLKMPHFDYNEFEKVVDVRSTWNKEKLLEEWKESIIVPVYRKSVKKDCINYRDTSICQLRTNYYPTSCCQG